MDGVTVATAIAIARAAMAAITIIIIIITINKYLSLKNCRKAFSKFNKNYFYATHFFKEKNHNFCVYNAYDQ